MGQPFIGEIRMVGFTFAPAGWAFCDGQLIPISENDALFNLIGTTYGGDGQETFALPDLRGRIPIHQDSGLIIGQMAGVETVTLNVNQIPIHTHVPQALSGSGNNTSPAGNVWAGSTQAIYTNAAPTVNMNPNASGVTGGSQPHENMMPFLVISYIISLFGVFPSQT